MNPNTATPMIYDGVRIVVDKHLSGMKKAVQIGGWTCY